MSDFILSCCSTSDLTLEHYKKRLYELTHKIHVRTNDALLILAEEN